MKIKTESLMARAVGVGRVGLMLLAGLTCNAEADYSYKSSSFLGGTGTSDSVRGSVIQDDGTLVLAANISDASPGGLVPVLLNGANSASSGAVLRLSADGKTVLSVTRLAGKVNDLARDADGELYVACMADGMVKLNPTASAVVYSKSYPGVHAWRVDSGPAGNVVVLTHSSSDQDRADPGSGVLHVYGVLGNLLSEPNGMQNTMDVCLDENSGTVIHVGWRAANAFDGNKTFPVHIPYLRGRAFDGTEKYTGYNWSSNSSDPDFLNTPTNNMADSRITRCAIGADGKLYISAEVAGGNHVFRYQPYLDKNNGWVQVGVVGGDFYHNWYNTKSEHKTYFARHEAATGLRLKGQQFCARLSSGKGSGVKTRAISADSEGRVYLSGNSGSGLPLTLLQDGTGTYSGGGFLLVMSADFTQRLACVRTTPGGSGYAVAAQGPGQIVFGGDTSTSAGTYTLNAIQPSVSTLNEGFVSVFGDGSATANAAPTAAATASPSAGTAPLNVAFNGSGSSDSDGAITGYVWDFGDGTTGTGANPSHTYTNAGEYTATLTVTDNANATSSASKLISVSAPTPPTGGSLVPVSASATAFQSPNSPGNAIDGNLSSGSRWSVGGIPQSLTIDYGQVVNFTAVKIAFMKSQSRTSTFKLDVSTEGTTFTSLLGQTISSLTPEAEFEPFAVTPASSRYLRFTGYGNSENDWNSVIEIEAVGTTGGGSSLRPADALSGGDAGLNYSYYEGSWSALPDFGSLSATASGTEANFSLAPRLRQDNFGFGFSGYIDVPTNGSYTFYTKSDDGSALDIGDTRVVDNDGLHAASEKSGTIALQAGLHEVAVEFFERTGGELLEVRYEGPGVAKQLIPDTALFRNLTPPASGLSVDVNGTANVFTAEQITSYSTTQDGNNAVAEIVGGGLRITGNAWKSVPLNYKVTAKTVIEIDLVTPDIGELIGIGFDNDNDHTNQIGGSGTAMILAGSQSVPSNMRNIKSLFTAPGPQTVSIPVGTYYTGAIGRLCFFADDDADGSGEATFSNIRISESD